MVDTNEAQSSWSGRQTSTATQQRFSSSEGGMQGCSGHLVRKKDTCVSAIYDAVEGIPDALEITDKYILEKDILPQDYPDNKVLASKPLERLVNR